mmetsp:Transcript_45962/g.132547  ORF Transcript_45962/g.132547 Transcript_45962/m.132547 type:complete len:237 (+) Transcript_45962:2431-3141(+)
MKGLRHTPRQRRGERGCRHDRDAVSGADASLCTSPVEAHEGEPLVGGEQRHLLRRTERSLIENMWRDEVLEIAMLRQVLNMPQSQSAQHALVADVLPGRDVPEGSAEGQAPREEVRIPRDRLDGDAMALQDGRGDGHDLPIEQSYPRLGVESLAQNGAVVVRLGQYSYITEGDDGAGGVMGGSRREVHAAPLRLQGGVAVNERVGVGRLLVRDLDPFPVPLLDRRHQTAQQHDTPP